ncbi:transmembrane protein PMIS2 [Rattus norvegicus]|uniref:transmembrane protein PMIS2 n=1 Tax=Rattus norvegicus TaxID=10116 RepID=UPI002FD86FA4
MARQPLGRPQTEDEKKFHARNHILLSLFSIIVFLPLGVVGLYFSIQHFWPQKPIPMLPPLQAYGANQSSDWEDAYRNSSRALWFDVLAILIFLAVLYVAFLVL